MTGSWGILILEPLGQHLPTDGLIFTTLATSELEAVVDEGTMMIVPDGCRCVFQGL